MIFLYHQNFFRTFLSVVYYSNANTDLIEYIRKNPENIYTSCSIDNLVYLFYNEDYEAWIVYYTSQRVTGLESASRSYTNEASVDNSNQPVNVDHEIEKYINKKNIYLAHINENFEITLYQSFHPNGHIETYQNTLSDMLDVTQPDYCMIDETGGIFHVNSSNVLDFIFSNESPIESIPVIKTDLTKRLAKIQNDPCPEDFVNLCMAYYENDPKFYEFQMESFHDSMMHYFSNLEDDKCIQKFIYNFKRSLMHELITIYYRTILYPHEKDSIVKSCRIENIIEKIHERHIELNKILVWQDIEDIFYYHLYCSNGIMEYLTHRMIYMNVLYDVFLATKEKGIKPVKHGRIKCKHYPFKVFCPEIFIVCSLID